ncbi:RluA family pseudouridine synthase [Desulfitobacterium sp. AusDCA]|uniref:RluA family pseudouridine synthase n=1 Tax=Desulfitobacterium sp. AusDCA TaxID=3240383 RepID=UPI003DA6FFE4
MKENQLDMEDEEFESLALAEDNPTYQEGKDIHEFELPEGIRLDVGVTEVIGKTRSFVQSLIGDGFVHVNGLVKKSNYKMRSGDRVKVIIPPPKELQVEAENIPLDIVYEDDDVLVVNKPQGMVVHPAPGSWNGTLVNALLYHCRNLSGINGVIRPGIVHRIDKDTSGLLVVAKNDQAHQGLAAQIKEHSMARKYIAIVHGVVLESTGTVEAPIGRDTIDRKKMAVSFHNSKSAVTHYEVLERFREFTFLRARLETGRTHQIRVHMAYLKHPVLGDPLYGPRRNPFGIEGQMLHAEHLGFVHPRTGEWLEFTVEPPEIFIKIINQLKNN